MFCLEGTGAVSHVSVRNTIQFFNEPCTFAAISIKEDVNVQDRNLVFVLAVLYSHFIQFPPFDIPYNLYHRETLWSNTEKWNVR